MDKGNVFHSLASLGLPLCPVYKNTEAKPSAWVFVQSVHSLGLDLGGVVQLVGQVVDGVLALLLHGRDLLLRGELRLLHVSPQLGQLRLACGQIHLCLSWDRQEIEISVWNRDLRSSFKFQGRESTLPFATCWKFFVRMENKRDLSQSFGFQRACGRNNFAFYGINSLHMSRNVWKRV